MESSKSLIKEYIQNVNTLMPNRERKFMEHALAFPVSGDNNIKRGKLKECYKNSADLVMFDYCSDRSLIYCEGYAVPSNIGFPVQHAWVYDTENSVVLDPTWEDLGIEYAGIPFARNFLNTVLLHTGYYGNLIYSRLFIEGTPDLFLAKNAPANYKKLFPVTQKEYQF